MKHFVQIFLGFLFILGTGCDEESKISPITQDDELIEVYVQISLINDSELNDNEKKLLIDKFLSNKNLTKEIIDLKLDNYRADPAEWRSFFMSVQSRLRELQRESREKKIEDIPDPATQIVDTVIVHTEQPIHINNADTMKLLTAVTEPDTSYIATESFDSLIAVVEDTIIEETLFTRNYSGASYESDELGLFLYEIKPKDNLSTLASLYDSETDILVMINGIVSANSIRIGQKILIPNTVTNIIVHTIASGDVLSRIAGRYDSEVEQIIFLNQIDNVNAININDLLYIPVRKTETEGNE